MINIYFLDTGYKMAISIGLGTGFWFFHEILSFNAADFEYNPQNREY